MQKILWLFFRFFLDRFRPQILPGISRHSPGQIILEHCSITWQHLGIYTSVIHPGRVAVGDVVEVR
jgi:hypothetical protein